MLPIRRCGRRVLSYRRLGIGLMRIRRAGDTDNPRWEDGDWVGSVLNSSTDQTYTDESDEQEESPDAKTFTDGVSATKTALTSGAIFGAIGPTVEQARRLGIDRYDEAGLAERAYAETYAKKRGGKVVDDGSSVFTPDGGIDGIVRTESNQYRIQSKHYGEPVGNHILEQYSTDVDVIGATNGVAENADPDAYNLEVVTRSDWSWRKKASLQGRRVFKGTQAGIFSLKDSLLSIGGSVTAGVKYAVKRGIAHGKWLGRRLGRIGSPLAAWFKRRSLFTQIVIVVAVVGAVYLLWQWYTDDDDGMAGEETR